MLDLWYEMAVMVKGLSSRFRGGDTGWRGIAIPRSPSDGAQLNCAAPPLP